MIEAVVALLLHNKIPVAVVDNVELPQLSITLTMGDGGVTLGAAIAEPGRLLQPFIVCVTV